MVFVVVNYSHKAARHVCLCVYIGFAVGIYAAFVSVSAYRPDVSRFKSTSVEYSYGLRSD